MAVVREEPPPPHSVRHLPHFVVSRPGRWWTRVRGHGGQVDASDPVVSVVEVEDVGVGGGGDRDAAATEGFPDWDTVAVQRHACRAVDFADQPVGWINRIRDRIWERPRRRGVPVGGNDGFTQRFVRTLIVIDRFPLVERFLDLTQVVP